MFDIPESAICLVDNSAGIYIPQAFANMEFHSPLQGIDAEDISILRAGPSHDWYWETWNHVEGNCIITGIDGARYTLLHDCDLWAVPEDYEWPED